MALVFGGGSLQGRWSDAIVQLASLPLLVLVLLNLSQMRVPRGPILLIGLLVALPLLQLIPLPPGLWTALPGRENEIQVYSALGQPLPWLPISLSPIMTWRSALSLLPVVAISLGMLCLSALWRRILVVMFLAFVFFSVFVDLTQMVQGTDSALRFYSAGDRAVGFFANSNHNAALLYSAIPFAAAFGIGFHRQSLSVLLVLVLLGAIIVGLAIAQSRAGLILCAVAGISCFGLVLLNSSGSSRRRLIIAAVAGNLIALLIVFQVGFVSLTQRMESADVVSDSRWPVASLTWNLIEANLPLGTGFGTFVPVYQAAEPRTFLFDRFMNRAHNDWLEIALEGGVLSIAGLLIFLVWFVRASLKAWRAPAGADPLDAGLARASSIVVLLLMLHSAVDYPLRTTAMMVVFCFACALLVLPRQAPAGAVSRG
ncbi:MAG: O-antigen ligase family protein [Pseudolabrys sp.]